MLPRQAKDLLWPAEWGLARCVACGLIFRHPMPDDDAIAAMYVQDYYDSYGRTIAGHETLAPDMRNRLDRLDSLRPQHGKMIEIGSAHGVFLMEARQRGWDVQGVELSTYTADAARTSYDLPIFNGTLAAAAFSDATFDVAHMNHVLEHLPDPVGTLRELRRVVKPGGLVVIEVPQEFTGIWEPIMKLRGHHPAASMIPSPHLFFYRPSTLRRALAQSGFTQVQLRTYRSSDYSTQSRWPGGSAFIGGVFGVERALGRAPLLEAYAS